MILTFLSSIVVTATKPQLTRQTFLKTMSGALPQQPEEFLDHVRTMPNEHVPSVEEELDEYLMLREVGLIQRLRTKKDGVR